jgi:hypothetical protein
MNNSKFYAQKGSNIAITKRGIDCFGCCEDMFIASQDNIKISDNFEFTINFVKIDKLGGFIIRFYQDIYTCKFRGFYFIHRGSYYSIEYVYNDEDGRWIFEGSYGILQDNEVLDKNGLTVRITFNNNIINIFCNKKHVTKIDNSYMVYDIIGKISKIGFDSCLCRTTIQFIEYKSNEKAVIQFRYENEKEQFTSLTMNCDAIFLSELNDETICKIIDKKIFNKLIFKYKPSASVFNYAKGKAIIGYCDKDIKYLFSMTHTDIVLVFKNNDVSDSFDNNYLYENIKNEDLFKIFILKEEVKIDNKHENIDILIKKDINRLLFRQGNGIGIHLGYDNIAQKVGRK